MWNKNYLSATKEKKEIAQWVHHVGSIRQPYTPWVDALPWSYVLLPCLLLRQMEFDNNKLWNRQQSSHSVNLFIYSMWTQLSTQTSTLCWYSGSNTRLWSDSRCCRYLKLARICMFFLISPNWNITKRQYQTEIWHSGQKFNMIHIKQTFYF